VGPQPGTPRWRRWAGRAGLLLGGLVVGAALAEGGARLLAPAPAAELLGEPSRDATPGLYQMDAQLGHVPVPGYRTTWPSPEGEIAVEVAPDGSRAPGPPAGLPRWLAVGDSYTLAVQVDAGDTFAAQLAARAGIGAVNAGVDGYGTWESHLRYARLADATPVEGVLYTLFSGNDLTDNPAWRGRMRVQSVDAPLPPAPPGHAGPGRPIVPYRPATWAHRLKRWSVLFSAVHVLRHQPVVAANGTLTRYKQETLAMTRPGAGHRRGLLQELGAALRRFGAAAESRGDVLWVVLAPAPWMLDDASAAATLGALGHPPADADIVAFHRDLLATVDATGLPRCDLLPALRNSVLRGESPFLRYDGHFSARGHVVAAAAIARCLSEGPGPR
jgi:hypothetical protein